MNVIYESLIVGDLDPHWSVRFDGMAVIHPILDETMLRGSVRDQAELYGMLNKFRDLGLTRFTETREPGRGMVPRLD